MKVTDAQYAKGSPLLLMACALYMDAVTNQCVAQLKWRNLDSRPVKAILIELDGYDEFNQRLEPVSFHYANLEAPQGKDFGSRVPVPIRDASMVRYEVLLKAVLFATGDVWQADQAVPFSVLPQGKEMVLTGELYEQYEWALFNLGLSASGQFQPQTAMGLWQCGCGSWQAEGTPCLNCKATMSLLQKYANPQLLEECLDAQYAAGSPLLLMTCALYQDAVSGQRVAQLKWRNLDSRPVKAVLIELDGYDASNQRLEPITFRHDGLMAAQGDVFASRIPIRDAGTVRYETILKAVSFATGDMWQAKLAVPFSALPPGKEMHLEDALYEQYMWELSNLGFSAAAQFQPQTAMGLWQCGCGSWQAKGMPCLNCKATMSGLQECANPRHLEEDLKEYLTLYTQE